MRLNRCNLKGLVPRTSIIWSSTIRQHPRRIPGRLVPPPATSTSIRVELHVLLGPRLQRPALPARRAVQFFLPGVPGSTWARSPTRTTWNCCALNNGRDINRHYFSTAPKSMKPRTPGGQGPERLAKFRNELPCIRWRVQLRGRWRHVHHLPLDRRRRARPPSPSSPDAASAQTTPPRLPTAWAIRRRPRNPRSARQPADLPISITVGP